MAREIETQRRKKSCWHGARTNRLWYGSDCIGNGVLLHFRCLYLCAAVIMLSKWRKNTCTNRLHINTQMFALVEPNLCESAWCGMVWYGVASSACMHKLWNQWFIDDSIAKIYQKKDCNDSTSFIFLVLVLRINHVMKYQPQFPIHLQSISYALWIDCDVSLSYSSFGNSLWSLFCFPHLGESLLWP